MSVRILPHRSELLAGNPLGDPVDREVIVILPASYESSTRRYPVVYWLAGFGSRGAAFLANSPVHEPLSARLQRSGLEAISVLPDCTTRYGGSQYIDSAGTGPYQRYLLDELVPFIDANFRTEPEAARRAIVGRSSGGFGALVAVLHRPDVVRLAGCLAPDAGFEHCYAAFFPAVLDTFRARGGYERFVRAPLDVVPKDGTYMLALSLVAMATCYSPSATGFDFPVDPETGVFRDDVWQRWLAHDPVRTIANHGVPRELAWLYLDVGDRDEYAMHWGARALHATLAERGVAHHYSEFPGGHQGVDHRWDQLLAALAKVL